MRVEVIGAGITGLTTAWLLLKEGVDVTIHEARDREAGLAGSWRNDGFAFDFGPHEFCTDDPRLVEILETTCGDDLLRIEKQVAQYFKGRYLRYPFTPIDVLLNLPFGLGLRALAEATGLQLRRLVVSPGEASFEEWTRDRFGKTLWNEYFGPYTEKVWGVPPSELDADVARQRITVDSAWGLLKKTIAHRLLRRQDWRHTHSEFRHEFFYVRRGMGTLAAALLGQVLAMGGKLEYGRRLIGVRRRGDRASELVFGDGTRVSGFDHVVSTIPLPGLVRIALPRRAARLIADHPLRFRGLVFCFVRLARPDLLGHHWVYYPGADVPFQRITESGRFGADMAPPGHTGLTLEVASDPGDGFWELDDSTIERRCLEALSGTSELRPEDVLGVDVVRIRNAYPLQLRGFAAHTETHLEALGDIANLLTIGRQGLFRYCNMNECMEMALDVVPRITAGEEAIRCRTDATWRGVSVPAPQQTSAD